MENLQLYTTSIDIKTTYKETQLSDVPYFPVPLTRKEGGKRNCREYVGWVRRPKTLCLRTSIKI